MRRRLRPERSKSDALVVREALFPPGTPVPVIMREFAKMTKDEIHELAEQIRADHQLPS